MHYRDPKKYISYKTIPLVKSDDYLQRFKNFLYYGIYGNYIWYKFKIKEYLN